jgi:integrase
MPRLTDPQLRAMIVARSSVAGVSDGDGLTFTLSASGTASWVLRYRLDGRQRELTLGNYPDMGLADARRAAGAARAKVDARIDVATEKRRARRQRAQAPTLRELVLDYLARSGLGLAERGRREIRRYLDKDITPRMGAQLACDVGPEDVIGTVEAIAKRSDSVARRAFEILNVAFAHGLAKHLVRVNPCAGLRIVAILGPRKARRRRLKLSADELRQVLGALPALGRENELAIKILLATCVRKGELVRAKASELELERGLWNVPDEHAKGGRGYAIPLAPIVAAWFQELIELARGSSYVLPARTKIGRIEDRPIHLVTLNVALDRLQGGARAFSPHDLRSTARSHLAELGVDLIVAERCLNHSLGGLVAVYDQHDYLDERRRALQLWAKRLEDLEPRPTAVLQLRAAA